jgi:hypothetical protein
MPSCPYQNHRLRLDDRGHCERCDGDLRVYAALHDLSVTLYNEARRVWDLGDMDQAESLSRGALRVRESFREAHWLLGAIALRRGGTDDALLHLTRARQLGAPIDDRVPVDASAPDPDHSEP